MAVSNLPWLQGRSILLVDGDRAVRDAIYGLLEPYNCRMIMASAGSDALVKVGTSPRVARLDAVITEMRLPDMNSYELVTRLQELLGPLAIILMTRFGYDPNCLGKHVQSSKLLYKPFRSDQLFRALETALVGNSAADGNQCDDPKSL
ncbi:MAG: response regulator [Planctomycetota bacterium]